MDENKAAGALAEVEILNWKRAPTVGTRLLTFSKCWEWVSFEGGGKEVMMA